MLDLLEFIGELILLIISIPLVLIGAILIGILYFLYIIKEFIKAILFDK